MTAALAVVALVELGLIAWGLAHRRGLARYEKRRVTVHTLRPDDQSIRGVLVGVYRDCIELSSPEYLHEARPEGVNATAVIPRVSISWMEVL